MTTSQPTTALLDLKTWVEVISFDSESAACFVRDEDGDEFEVNVNRLDNFEGGELDLLPLEA